MVNLNPHSFASQYRGQRSREGGLSKSLRRSEIESPRLTSWGFSLTPTEHEGLNRQVKYPPNSHKENGQLSPGPVWLGLFM